MLTTLEGYYLIVELFNFDAFITILIVPAIIGYYWINSKIKRKDILFALFFCWIGNLFILFDLNASFQQWGVFSLWIMNLFFFIRFMDLNKMYFFREHILGLVFYFSYLIVFLNHVYSFLDDMKFHGIVYSFTSAIFGSFTLMLLLKNMNTTNFMFFFGLFLLSIKDVMLTYNKKFFEEDFFSSYIIILQIVGLFLLIRAFINFEDGNMKQLVSNAKKYYKTKIES